MQTVVYISDKELQIANGKRSGKLKRLIIIPIPEGVVTNGIINDIEQLCSIILSLKFKFIKTKLILDNIYVITKRLEIPRLNKKQIEMVVRSELADALDSFDELVYNYSLHEKNRVLLCCAIERKIIDSYKQLFDMCNIKLNSIDIGINGLIKFTQTVSNLKKKTFVINVVRDENILSLLFENNSYVLSTRLRLNNTDDEMIDELYNKLSSLIQFNKAQKTEFELTASYYCGLSDMQLEKLNQLVENNMHIGNLNGMFKFKTLFDWSSVIYLMTGCYTIKHDVNFLITRAAPKLKRVSIRNVFATFATTFLVLIGGMYYAYLFRENESLIEKIKRTEISVNDSSFKNSYTEALANSNQLDLSNTILTSTQKINDSISKTPVINSIKFNKIFAACEKNVSISALEFSANDKTLKLTANAINASDVTNFMSRLKTLGIFTDVNYPGYKLNTSSNSYTFSATCYLKAGDEK